jgi:hypothetical protein
MTQRTRNFLIGSAAVALVGVGTGLVAYYNGGLLTSRVAESELAYLPADAVAVGYADVRTIMNSEFRQKVRQVMPAGTEQQKFQQELGLDIEKDIDAVAAAYSGGHNGLGGAVVVVRGRFNEGQIEAKAVEHGGRVEEYRGKRMLVMTAEAHAAHMGNTSGPTTGGVTFLEPGLLMLGEASAMKKAIDSAAAGQDIRKNAELMNMVNDVRGTGNAWFVGSFEHLTSEAPLPAEVRNHLPAVNLFAISANVNGGVSGQFRAEARDEEAANQLRDIIRGAMAVGQLASGQNPKVDAMMKSIQMTGTGKTVGLTFAMPPEMLDLLNGLAAGRPKTTPNTPR